MNIYILAVKHVCFFLLKVNERGTTALNFGEKSKKKCNTYRDCSLNGSEAQRHPNFTRIFKRPNTCAYKIT